MKLHEVAKQSNRHTKIKQWLDQHEIKNYTIRPDGIVDVDGRVALTGDVLVGNENSRLITLPIQFGKVNGVFSCAGCVKLKSIKGFPQYVMNNLYCDATNITSLSGIDKIIKQISGGFYCDAGVTHILGLLLIKGITKIDIDQGHTIDQIMNKYLGTGDILSAQDELIDAGLIDQARL